MFAIRITHWGPTRKTVPAYSAQADTKNMHVGISFSSPGNSCNSSHLSPDISMPKRPPLHPCVCLDIPLKTFHGTKHVPFTVIFFFNLFIYFHWRLITLQYCSVFCHTLTWISHGYTCVPWTPLPPPSPSHPSGSSQCTSPEHPVSCIKPGLVIYFTCGDTLTVIFYLIDL